METAGEYCKFKFWPYTGGKWLHKERIVAYINENNPKSTDGE